MVSLVIGPYPRIAKLAPKVGPLPRIVTLAFVKSYVAVCPKAENCKLDPAPELAPPRDLHPSPMMFSVYILSSYVLDLLVHFIHLSLGILGVLAPFLDLWCLWLPKLAYELSEPPIGDDIIESQ